MVKSSSVENVLVDRADPHLSLCTGGAWPLDDEGLRPADEGRLVLTGCLWELSVEDLFDQALFFCPCATDFEVEGSFCCLWALTFCDLLPDETKSILEWFIVNENWVFYISQEKTVNQRVINLIS